MRSATGAARSSWAAIAMFSAAGTRSAKSGSSFSRRWERRPSRVSRHEGVEQRGVEQPSARRVGDAGHGQLEGVVVAVAVRVGAGAVDALVLGVREVGAAQHVSGREAVAAGQRDHGRASRSDVHPEVRSLVEAHALEEHRGRRPGRGARRSRGRAARSSAGPSRSSRCRGSGRGGRSAPSPRARARPSRPSGRPACPVRRPARRGGSPRAGSCGRGAPALAP